MRESGTNTGIPQPPRGTFLVTPESPTIAEPSYGDSEPLFLETEDPTGTWKERTYAVVAPEGSVITGAELRVTGRLLKSSSNHSFGMRLFPMPMPANYHNAWIAALYGQSRNVSTLEKYVPFHGNSYSRLLLQLTEHHSEIFDWELRLTLKPTASDSPTFEPTGPEATMPEGRVLGYVTNGRRSHFGPSQPQYLYLAQPRRSLAIVDNGRDGLTLISARGSVGNEPTDLWMSRSANGESWTTPMPLSTNSASEDYAPQLLRAEDGSLRLFWLSDRRGRGWELWTSRLPRGEFSDWSSAVRVPLDRFSPSLRSAPALDFAESPHFAAVQDRRGRWILVFYDRTKGRILSLVSRDGVAWDQAGEGIATAPLVGLTIAEGSDGVMTMLGVEQTGGLVGWRSNDLGGWVRRDAAPEQLFRPRYGFNYAGYLFPEPDGRFLAILSDSIYGLQFARFGPERQDPVRDLVPGVTLEAFAATPAAGGGYLVAHENGEDIAIRHYQLTAKAANGGWPLATPLYTTTASDSRGNRWSRTIAGARVILPDVTAVATQSDGRVWWGIETGVFSLHNGTMLFSDGSMGYPFHTTTEIEPCGEKVYFASRYSQRPRIAVGRVASLLGMDLLKTDEVPLETDGRITRLACGNDGSLFVGTSIGEILVLDSGGSSFSRWRLEGADGVSALAADTNDGSILIGTDRGRVYRFSDAAAPLPSLPAGGHAVQALSIGPSGGFVGRCRGCRVVSAARFRLAEGILGGSSVPALLRCGNRGGLDWGSLDSAGFRGRVGRSCIFFGWRDRRRQPSARAAGRSRRHDAGCRRRDLDRHQRRRTLPARGREVMRYRVLLMSLVAGLLASGASAETAQRLLVLPFDNATGSPDFDGLADGAEDLLPVCLSNHAAGPVVVERGVLNALISEKGLQWEGLLDNAESPGSPALLGADVLVRGSLSGSGDSIKLSVFLYDVETTQLIASSAHEGPRSDAFELFCNDAAGEIARALSDGLSAPTHLPADSDPLRTQLLLLGVGHYYNGHYAEAFPAFMKLLRRDEADPEARFWLARSFLGAGMTTYAEHELKQFIVRFPVDRNHGRAKELLREIESNREN